MNEYIDIYCERLEPGLWAEPLNAFSNGAFFIAAFFAYRLARREGTLNAQSGLLIILLTAIGIGSSLFHTLASAWSQMADVLPILFFQVGFLLIYARQVMSAKSWQVLVLLLVFIGCIYGFGSLPSEWLNGSLGYAPALLFLSGYGIYHWRTAKVEPFVLLLAASIFIISLTFRSVDMKVCNALPIGVHYMWHILNACVLYLTLRGLLLNMRV